MLYLLVEAWISFGHFPGWKGQLAVREKLAAAAVVEDQPAESQRWTDQDRCLVSYHFFLIYPENIQACQAAVTNKQLFAGLNTNTFPISTGKKIYYLESKQRK